MSETDLSLSGVNRECLERSQCFDLTAVSLRCYFLEHIGLDWSEFCAYARHSTVLHDILDSKSERHEFDRWSTWCIRHWLDSCTQRVAFNSLMFKWKPLTSGVP